MSGVALAIETSNPSSCPGEVALVEGERLLGVEGVGGRDAGGGDDLVPAIDRSFRRAGVDRRSLARVAVSLGPGGYTGVRVAVTVAKALALATGCACVGVPTARVALVRAAREGAPRPGERLGVALASKGPSTHATVFGTDGRASESRVIEATDLDALRAEGLVRLVADRFLPEAMRRRCAELAIAIEELRLGAWACAEASRDIEPVEPADLAPIYPRPPEAVRLWRARTGPR